jgi:Peptidase C13 family
MRAEGPRVDGWRRCILGRGMVVWLAVLLIAGGAPAIAAAAEAAATPSPQAAAPKAHIVSLGLWGLQNLFRTEANQAAAVLRAYYGRGGQVVVKANTPATAAAAAVTSAALQAALRGVAAQMNREQDLLVLVLTSHGSPQGIGIRTRRHGELLTPDQLRGYLQETGAANKVVIVSACFSGIFAALADAHTLVITAADATHPSFGCSDRANMTFFGELFFNGAVPERATLPEAFALARGQIKQLEDELCTDPKRKAAGACNSNPQIAGGEAFAGTLRAAPVSAAARTRLQLGESRQKFCKQAGLAGRVSACRRGA